MFSLIKIMFKAIVNIFSTPSEQNPSKDNAALARDMQVICYALSCVALFFWIEKTHLQAQLQEQRQEQAAQLQSTQKAGQQRLQQANELANRLVIQIEQQKSDFQLLEKEKHYAIQNLAQHRPCLSDSIVRVLNQATSRDTTATLPQATATAIDADAAFATDSDVANWIASAQAQYEELRARHEALIAFEEKKENKDEHE